MQMLDVTQTSHSILKVGRASGAQADGALIGAAAVRAPGGRSGPVLEPAAEAVDGGAQVVHHAHHAFEEVVDVLEAARLAPSLPPVTSTVLFGLRRIVPPASLSRPKFTG
jgi:hypothetical protein